MLSSHATDVVQVLFVRFWDKGMAFPKQQLENSGTNMESKSSRARGTIKFNPNRFQREMGGYRTPTTERPYPQEAA